MTDAAIPMTTDPTLGFVMDGLILQRAGELLLFDPYDNAEREHRRKCRYTYIRCLEDFSFGVLFGEKFIYNGLPPTLKATQPGQKLIKKFEPIFEFVPHQQHSKPDDLLEDPDFRERIIEALQIANESLKQNKTYWIDWISTELTQFLPDNSYYDVNGDEITFKKSPPPMYNKELQSYIKRNELSNLLGEISIGVDVDRTVALEFFSRMLLTHIVIWRWGENYRPQLYRQFRVPYITRSLIHKNQISVGSHDPYKSLEPITRHALADVLGRIKISLGDQRLDICDLIYDLREEKMYTRIRGLFQQLDLDSNSNESRRNNQIIQDEISQIAIREFETFELLDPITIDVPRSTALRKITPVINNKYETALYQVFPELNPEENNLSKQTFLLKPELDKAATIATIKIFVNHNEQYILILRGTIDTISRNKAEDIVAHLRELIKDASLTLIYAITSN